MSIRNTLIALSLVVPALSAFALDQGDVAKSVQLKDGTTVHQFKDGKMAMEGKFGRAERMPAGHTMETADGKSIVMVGDEVARLSHAIHLRSRK